MVNANNLERFSYQAYRILHIGFTIAPIMAGADKFLGILGNWTRYLAPIIPQLLGLSPFLIMLIVGIIEVIAGIIVGLKPRIGSLLVAGWLLGIIVNLFILGEYLDVALRDFGLFLGAMALSRLSKIYD